MVKTKRLILVMVSVLILLGVVLLGLAGCQKKKEEEPRELTVREQALNFNDECLTNLSNLDNLKVKMDIASDDGNEKIEDIMFFKKTSESISMYSASGDTKYWFNTEECGNAMTVVRYYLDESSNSHYVQAQYKFENTPEFTKFFLEEKMASISLNYFLEKEMENAIYSIQTNETTGDVFVMMSVHENISGNVMPISAMWTYSKLTFGENSFYALTNITMVGATTGMFANSKINVSYEFEDAEMTNIATAEWDRMIPAEIVKAVNPKTNSTEINIEKGTKTYSLDLVCKESLEESSVTRSYRVECGKVEPYSIWTITGFDTSTAGKKVMYINYLGLTIEVPYTVFDKSTTSAKEQAYKLNDEFLANICKLQELQLKMTTTLTYGTETSEKSTYFWKQYESMKIYHNDEGEEHWLQSGYRANEPTIAKFYHNKNGDSYDLTAECKYENSPEFTRFMLDKEMENLDLHYYLEEQFKDGIISIEVNDREDVVYVMLSAHETIESQTAALSMIWTFKKTTNFCLTNIDMILTSSMGVIVSSKTKVDYYFQYTEIPEIPSSSIQDFIIENIDRVSTYPLSQEIIVVEKGASDLQVLVEARNKDGKYIIFVIDCNNDDPYSCWTVTGFDTLTTGEKTLEIKYLGLEAFTVHYIVVENVE